MIYKNQQISEPFFVQPTASTQPTAGHKALSISLWRSQWRFIRNKVYYMLRGWWWVISISQSFSEFDILYHMATIFINEVLEKSSDGRMETALLSSRELLIKRWKIWMWWFHGKKIYHGLCFQQLFICP